MKPSMLAIAISALIAAAPASAAQKGPKPHAAPKTAATTHVHAAGKPAASTHVKSSPSKANVKIHAKTNAAKATKVKSAPTTTIITTTTIGTLTPVQQKLQRNTNLAAKLQSRLPAGTDLMAASAGFRNLGQFVATVNASHNHNLSFTELKRRIVVQGMSLGQAMQDLR